MTRLVVAVAIAIALSGCSRTPTRPATAEPATLLTGPTELDLGKVPAGGKSKQTIFFVNEGLEPVVVDEISTSCDCLQLTPSRVTVARSERVPFHVNLNLAREAAFAGNLRIEVSGKTPSGAIAFNLVARVESVRRGS